MLITVFVTRTNTREGIDYDAQRHPIALALNPLCAKKVYGLVFKHAIVFLNEEEKHGCIIPMPPIPKEYIKRFSASRNSVDYIAFHLEVPMQYLRVGWPIWRPGVTGW